MSKNKHKHHTRHGHGHDAAEASSSNGTAPVTDVAQTPAEDAVMGDIRGVLIQVAGARLLLPNATIAEVLS